LTPPTAAPIRVISRMTVSPNGRVRRESESGLAAARTRFDAVLFMRRFRVSRQ
jgi:hypothetical protein